MSIKSPKLNTYTFLVIDDSEVMRKIIKRTLRELGVTHIMEAGGSSDAWRVLQESHVDFILCDWNMPGEKGIDLLARVRDDPEYVDTPFLMVSAEARVDNIMQAIRHGVSNYLTKPFTSELLKRKILAVLDALEPGADNAVNGVDRGNGRHETHAANAVQGDDAQDGGSSELT